MSELTPLRLPESTPFPVKVFSIDIHNGDKIQKHQKVLRYSYWEFQDAPSTGEEPQDDHQPKKKVRVDLVGTFESPIDGVINEVLIKSGEEIISCDQVVVRVEEPCSHSVQFGGLCALCGKSLDEENDYSGFKYEDRAPISMSHGTSNLKISKDEAEKVEEKWTRTLLKDKKLILVVDLDQTVIHATVDPTIGEWMKDRSNANYPSLKDVQSFTLEETVYPSTPNAPKPPSHLRWYYVKLRPGLSDFLERVFEKYELHIYTMGTRAYAKSIAKCIDPDGKYFADRILSRDESGSLTQKSLERLFPTDTSMVVIIDDRGDVWNWSDHLIKVVPFDFFVGIGDINSNFLPQQKSLLGPSKRRGSLAQLQEKLIEENSFNREPSREAEDLERKIEELKEETKQKLESESNRAEVSIEEIQLTERQNEELLAARSSEREASLEAQKEERPLAKLQKNLDELVHNKGAERLLYDDDDELVGLEEALLKIHDRFYKQYETDGELPDIKYLLPSIKEQVFKGLHFVFTGLLPIGSNINNESIVIWVKSFGASVGTEITLETTHVITKSPHTYKARLAKSLLPNVKIVHPNWIFNSLTYWRRSDEVSFEVPITEDKKLPEEEVEKYKKKLEEKAQRGSSEPQSIEIEDEGGDLLAGDMDWLDDVEEEEFLDSSDDEEEGREANGKRSLDLDDVDIKRRKLEGDGEGDRDEDDQDEDDQDEDDQDEDDLAAELILGLDDD